jgi:hypothetical protein
LWCSLIYTNLTGTSQQSQSKALDVFRHANSIEFSKSFECRVAGPAIHWPFVAFLDNINEADLFQQSFTLFPSVESLAPLYGYIVDGLAPGIVEVIRA